MPKVNGVFFVSYKLEGFLRLRVLLSSEISTDSTINCRSFPNYSRIMADFAGLKVTISVFGEATSYAAMFIL